MTLAQKPQYKIVETEFQISDIEGNTFLSLNLENKDLLSARLIKEKIKYKFASFHFKHKIKENWRSSGLMPQLTWSGDTLLITGVLQKDKKNVTTYKLQFWLGAEQHLLYTFSTPQKVFDQLSVQFNSTKEEQFSGGGEQFSYLNFKGEKVPFFSEEQGIGRGDAPQSFFMSLGGVKGHKFSTYCAIPFVLSSEQRAIFLENTAYSEFDFRKKDKVEIVVNKSKMAGHIWTGENSAELIEKYTAYTGRMPELPDWAYGTCLGLQGGSKRVTEIVKGAKEFDNPVTAVWIQDWVGKRQTSFGSRLWWDWKADEKTYPEIKSFIEGMNAQGIEVLGYINPFLAEEGEQGKEAAEKGYVIMNEAGGPWALPMGGFNAYIMDLTNPEAREWYKERIKHLIDLGFKGWMADFSEWLPPGAHLHSGIDPMVYHNQYTVDWIKLNEEAVEESGVEDIVYFNRAGFSKVNKHARLMWTGDQLHSFKKNDGLAASITAVISSGLSGISFNHSDIGGYTSISVPIVRSIRSEDLFKRWTEVNAFMPVFRTHEGLKPEKNHQFYSDINTQEFFARMGKIHFALKDYFKIYAKEASQTGIPIIRPVSFLNDYAIPNQKQDYRFLVGEDLLVVPVLQRKSKKLKVDLPEGEWKHIWSGSIYKGANRYKLEVPYGKPAVFIKVGGAHEKLLQEAFQKFQ